MKGMLVSAIQKRDCRKKERTSFPLAFRILYLVALPIPIMAPTAFITPYRGITRFNTARPLLPAYVAMK